VRDSLSERYVGRRIWKRWTYLEEVGEMSLGVGRDLFGKICWERYGEEVRDFSLGVYRDLSRS